MIEKQRFCDTLNPTDLTYYSTIQKHPQQDERRMMSFKNGRKVVFSNSARSRSHNQPLIAFIIDNTGDTNNNNAENT